jgi:hypothetical protein
MFVVLVPLHTLADVGTYLVDGTTAVQLLLEDVEEIIYSVLQCDSEVVVINERCCDGCYE